MSNTEPQSSLAPVLQGALVAYLSQSPDAEGGPFAYSLDAQDPLPGRNYAAPRVGTSPTVQDVLRVIERMRAADRRPRFEFVSPNPALEEALAATGFVVTGRLPLMVLGRAGVRRVPPVPGVSVRGAEDHELLGAAKVQADAFGDPADPGQGADRLRHNLAIGGAVTVAVTTRGEVVGAGLATPPVLSAGRRLSELAVVAVAANHRRRGVGALLGAHLSRTATGVGTEPFLQVEGPAEQRVYERCGYVVVGEMRISEPMA